MIIYCDGELNTKGARTCIAVDSELHFIEKVNDNNLTHNDLEYLAIIHALKFIDSIRESIIKESEFIIASDSQLIINQINCTYKINYTKFENYVIQIKKLVNDKRINFKWIPREQNKAGLILEGKIK